MGKHDSKQQKLQVDIIDNKNDAVEYIKVRKKFRGSEGFDNSDPNDYLQRKDIEGLSGGNIKSWTPGTVAELGECLTHIVSGTIYLFRSTEEDNEVEPDIPLVGGDWEIIGVYKLPGEYTVGDIDIDGNIDVSDINPGTNRWLLGARVENTTGGITFTQVSGAEYDVLNAKVSGFGGWYGSTDEIVIKITFI